MLTNNYLNQSTQSDSKIITVEEGIDCRESNSRFFSLSNHESRLNIIISMDSTILSCKLAGHETVLDSKRQLQQSHETWSLGDKPYQKLSAMPWNSHVRGTELLLSTSNGASSLSYSLNRLNEFKTLVKLKSIHLQHQVTYFNLNSAKDKTPIDGHTLVVQCNGNMNRIRTQNTKLLCRCNKRSSILPQSLIGDIPFELVQNCSGSEAAGEPTGVGSQPDDIIVCDAIFSLESTSSMDHLTVKLQYNGRILIVEVRSSSLVQAPQVNMAATSSSSSVTSSTSSFNDGQRAKDSPSNFEAACLSQQACSSSRGGDNLDGAEAVDFSQMSSKSKWLSSLVDSSSASTCQSSSACSQSSYSVDANPTSNCKSSMSVNSVLRIRVRVTNYGVCIMPIMMTNYIVTYRFLW